MNSGVVSAMIRVKPVTVLAILFLQLAVHQKVFCNIEDGVVEVSQGRVMGRKLKTVNHGGGLYYSFQGIPYAKPPVGDLRFMPPKPYGTWEGTFVATKDRIRCPQEDPLMDRFPSGEEDCLILNVYTPSLPKNSTKGDLPVMFWIHGGGFTSGSSSTDFFGPDFFMPEEIVLVTVNYRLGVLGFLNLEDDVVSGNMGLKDIILALKWVQENIHVFNGDKNSVTIFGNNAGGTSISLLLHSPLANGLFSKAICQSGTYRLAQLFPQGPRKRAFALAKLLHKKPDSSEELVRDFRKINPEALIKASLKTYDSTETRDKQKSILPFGPSVENVTNTEEAFLAMMPEEFSVETMPNRNIPLMIGFNSKEAIVFLRALINDLEVLDKLNYNFQFAVPARGLDFEYNSPDYKSVASKIKQFYFTNGILSNRSMEEYVNYVSDAIFYPIHKTVEEHVKISKAKTFYYRFSFDGILNYFKNNVLNDQNSIKGATNGDEVCYLFKCGRLEKLYDTMHNAPVEPVELSISEKMVRMWANFAKFGNPTPRDDVVLHKTIWKPVSINNHYYLDIGEQLKINSNPGEKSVKFWDAIYDQYSTLKSTQSHIKLEL